MIFPCMELLFLIFQFFTECVFDGFSTGQRFMYSGMNFCNVLRFLAAEAIFSKDELGSQSGSFLRGTEYFFP